MIRENSKVTEIKLNDLVSFRAYDSQTYQGERLEQLMDSIARLGLMNPIIVRPVDGGKYEILCGHNRVKAVRELGHDIIQAYVKEGLSDDEAMEIFYDSNLNQQSFSDWNYAQKIAAVKYVDKLIRENSQQGRRTDLAEKNAGDLTSVQNRQKLDTNSKKETTRDKMARRMGISTATLSKYRSIIKLSDNLVESIGRLLDQKRISFEAAYLISRIDRSQIEYLIEYIDKKPSAIVNKDRLKEFCIDTRKKKPGILFPKHSVDKIRSVLDYKADDGILKPISRRCDS